jgi:hypothetical protein
MPERWIAPALFAEGSSDYHFLGELLPRVVRDAAHRLFGPDFAMHEPLLKLDAPPQRREAQVAQAVDLVADECNLLFIHADGNGDAERARTERVAPGAAAVAARHPEILIIACVPVRETEAWLLADSAAFVRVLGRAVPVDLPKDPESLRDPKQALRDVLTAASAGVGPVELLERFGQEITLDALRRLSAFRRLESDLDEALSRLDRRS